MSRLFWLTEEQVERIESFFQKSRGVSESHLLVIRSDPKLFSKWGKGQDRSADYQALFLTRQGLNKPLGMRLILANLCLLQ